MKKLVGGVFLLSLLTLTLVQSVDGETYTNITDKNVLEQLTNLKSYINNPEMIKPVWVQLKNGDDIIVVQGQLSIVDDGEFDIDIAIKGYTLKIHVEFTQATLEDSTPIDDWYIDTNDAQYLFTSDEQNISPIAEDVAKDVIESAESGTIANVLGLDGDGGLVKEARNSVVKPIYCHPVDIGFSTDGRIDCLIFNNDSTPFTPSTYADYLLELYEKVGEQIRIVTTGGINDSVNVYPAVCLTVRSAEEPNRFGIITAKPDGTSYTMNFADKASFVSAMTIFNDGVNKIN